MVLVSVVLSSFNHERYLPQSIESVLGQTFDDFELIITDDCSTDASQEVIQKYMHTDSRINAVFHHRNMGITKTLNDGLDRAHGKYVCFLDSDDLWVQNKLERQLEILRQDDKRLVWSEGDVINAEGEETGQVFTRFLNAPLRKSGYLFQELLCEQFILLQTLICRADYLRNLRFDPELKYVNDHRFLVDLAFRHEFYFMPERLAKYRLHGHNITLKRQVEWAKDKIRIRRYFLAAYSDWLSPRAKADIVYQIGFYLSRLGRSAEAKKYYLQALKIDHAHVNSALYTALALTRGDGLAGKLLLHSYNHTATLFFLLKSAGYSVSKA